MKEIVKYFNRLAAKISRNYNHLVFQTSSQLNSNKKKFVKYFNRLVTQVLFKLKNKTNYFLISFIFLILIYLSYLLVPIFYDKMWVKDTLENKLKEDFESLANLNGCIVFFISPRKFNKAIKEIKYYFSGRKILICREMTKFYEEYIRLNIDDMEPFKSDPKGELTIVISEKMKEKNFLITLKESEKNNIKKMIKKLSIKDITDLVSQNTNVPKKVIYNYCLKLKNEK